jgi:hypothetical protein
MENQNNENDWLTKERSETAFNRMQDRVTPGGIVVSNPALGINVYNNGISAASCIKAIETLESKLTNSTSQTYRWQGAMVTESDTPALDARD